LGNVKKTACSNSLIIGAGFVLAANALQLRNVSGRVHTRDSYLVI